MTKKHSSSIDNFRALAIIAIVIHHTCINVVPDTQYTVPYLIYANLTKYGTILFMVISGFLFQKNFHKYSIKSLIDRKIKTVVVPSIPFMLIWVFTIFFNCRNQDVTSLMFSIKNCLLYSPYWFIVNLFFIQIIHYYIKNVNNILNFIFFSVLTIFYCINIHMGWVATSNTNSTFAYLLFFHIGRIICENMEVIHSYYLKLIASKLKLTMFICFVLGLLMLSSYESFIIETKPKKYIIDALNILRIGNICFSVALFVLFYCMRKQLKLDKWFNGKSVFLIYLIHPYLLSINNLFCKFSPFTDTKNHGLEYIPFELFFTILVIVISLKLGNIIQSNKQLAIILDGKWRITRGVRKLRTAMHR
ncbi:MAG: acyltransferase family protein [Janthinobacterium lividum]